MTQLFAHQAEAVEKTWELPGFAFFWEPRVGKSLPQIHTAFRLHDAQKINAVIILAPNGVHHGWARDVVPEAHEQWCQGDVTRGFDISTIDWFSSTAGRSRVIKLNEELLKHPGLLIVCADSNGLTSPRLRDYLEKVVKCRETLLVLDESHYFKNHRAKRTRFVMRIAKRCPHRRILSGTPLTSPFDLWSQFHVLDPEVLGSHFVPFKTRYGIFEKKFFGPRAVEVVTAYKDLDDLKARIEPLSSWLTLNDVFPNLPEALPVERAYFELSKEHRQAYEQLKTEYILAVEGSDVMVNNPLVMILRLSQIARGHVTTDDGLTKTIPGDINSLDRLFHDIYERKEKEKIIVWCRFKQDVDNVVSRLTVEKIPHVRHDGQVDQETRLENRRLFQTVPEIRVFVGTPSTGGVGVDLTAGSCEIFYSHGFNLTERLQAMSRARGVNQTMALSTTDVVGLGTVDERCLSLMGARVDIVSKIQTRSGLLDVLRGSGSEEEVPSASESVEVEELSEGESADVIEKMIGGGA